MRSRSSVGGTRWLVTLPLAVSGLLPCVGAGTAPAVGPPAEVASCRCCSGTTPVEVVQQFTRFLKEQRDWDAQALVCDMGKAQMQWLCDHGGDRSLRNGNRDGVVVEQRGVWLWDGRLQTEIVVRDPRSGEESLFLLHAESVRWKVARVHHQEGRGAARSVDPAGVAGETSHTANLVIVDVSSPRATFASYLDAYEQCRPAGMHACMSRRLRRQCGGEDCASFCRWMDKALREREGHEPVLRYYRSLLPAIEKEFVAWNRVGVRFEILFSEGPSSARPDGPSRLAFVKEDDAWRMDVFDVVVPSGEILVQGQNR